MIEPLGPESPPSAPGPRLSRPFALVALILVCALVSGAVAAGVTVGVLHFQSRTNSREVNLGSRVSLTEDSATQQVAARALPAVVSIVTDEHGDSYGSGFLVTTDGYLVTNVAVVAGSSALTVLIPNEGRRRDARLVDFDCETGVAVLKIDQVSNLPTLSFGDSSQLKIGQALVALGGPFGSGRQEVRGIVSALHRSVAATAVARAPAYYADTVQTDADITAAGSGGPVLNVGGQVVGIGFASPGGSGSPAFALSSNSVQPVVEQIVQTGQLVVADLGVATLDLSPEDAAVRGLPVGSLVLRVAPGSPAEQAGIRAGDVITQIDDNRLDAAHPLSQVLRQHYRSSQRAVVSTARGGSSSQVQVTLGGGHPAC